MLINKLECCLRKLSVKSQFNFIFATFAFGGYLFKAEIIDCSHVQRGDQHSRWTGYFNKQCRHNK